MTGRTGSAPPIALEFEELLRELGAWEESEDEASGAEEEEEAAAAAAAAAVEAARQARYDEITARREKNKREMEEKEAVRAELKRARSKKRVVADGDHSEYMQLDGSVVRFIWILYGFLDLWIWIYRILGPLDLDL